MTGPLTSRPLDASTWGAFAELVERNNGVFGGCWCIRFHPECGQQGTSYRDVKEARVRTGGAHAALVLDQIARAGGGLVEAVPEATAGRRAVGRLLFSATLELFEEYGFTRVRQVGKHAWIVSRIVDPA